jgi:hypothetical protein
MCGDHHQKCQLVIWNGGKGILKADLFFFEFFLLRGPIRNPELGARPPEYI